MSANTIYLEAQQAKQAASYSAVIAEFEASKLAFATTETSPGSGFDIEYWLGLLPVPDLTKADITAIPDLASYHGNDLDPNVTKPTLVSPSAIALLAEQGYDSAYLEYIEQEIRTLTTDIISSVLPFSVYDSYYRLNSLTLARAASDSIDKAKEAEEGRGFSSPTMTLVRAVTEVITKWQKDSYEIQNNTSKNILDFAVKTYFESINNGIKIEDIRSRMILDYAKFYSRHNSDLADYYSLLVDEKIADSTLALNNLNNALAQEAVNVDLVKSDNKEEVDLVVSTFTRALERVQQEKEIDEEVVKRRYEAMEKIMEIYAAWMSSAVGSLQSTTSSKYDITE